MNAVDDEGDLDYQAGGRAWNPDRPDILTLLATARPEHLQPIYYGSNHTFLLTLDAGEDGESLAVYKPARGEYPLYDFPAGTLWQREIGTYLVNRLLGWSVVPPTVRGTARYGVGSVQLFIDSPPSMEVELEQLRPIALLDVLVNNADRKIDHCLAGHDGRLWAIDHGLTFHIQPKLRTAFWHFAGEELTVEENDAVRRLLGEMRGRNHRDARTLFELIGRVQWAALLTRTAHVAETGHFPDPRYKPVPYWR